MAEITYIIQFIASITLISVGVFILLCPGWALISAGALLYVSCAFRSISALLVTLRVNGVDNADLE